MRARGDLALLIGTPMGQGRAWTRPFELLRELVGAILTFPSPADALEGFFSHAEILRSSRRVLLVVDQRGSAEIRWTWVSLLAHLEFGPLILLVDELDPELERRARATGVLRCLEERHLARHPGLLVRAARRALERGLRLAGAPV